MKCTMDIIVDGPDERGRCKRRCSRRGCPKRTNWTPYGPERIVFECQAWPRPLELGSWVALMLEVFGVSKKRWRWLRAQFGLIEPCKCASREEWLNTLGGRIVASADSGKWYGRALSKILVTRQPTEQP
jgi:hypothetical protein